MIRVNTQSGSVYEVDETNMKARRVTGVRSPTFRFSEDGRWRTYEELFLNQGESMVVVWEFGVGDDGAHAQVMGDLPDDPAAAEKVERIRTTMTSRVLHIEEV